MASGATVLGELPPSSLFSFPPGSVPFGAPPPPPGSDSSSAFSIPENVYAAALDPRVPITIAALYAVSVKLLNRYNTSTGKKPWAISKTRPFQVFVVLHNVFLAVYSAWTFWGMLGGMRRAVVNPLGPYGIAATADSLCQLNGPAGYGAATVYNETLGGWSSLSSVAAVSLEANGMPNREVMGRLWNEGLSFYGWIFYLSKFYEVLDTFIILAKGKLSSTLQTYHHAGAMMCMWAGMRYMSAPIWMFVLVNSFIHALMYTYYTLTAFNVRVPTPIKRSLTTMQITQFLVGASYAMLHSFVSYTVPVTVYSEGLGGSADASSAPVADNVAASSADQVAKATLRAFENLKQMVFGAAATASSAANPMESIAPEAAASAPPAMSASTTWVTQPCITTSGETFAIWLNVLYLAPLTYLFVMFFIRSYLRRSNAEAVRAKAVAAANGSHGKGRMGMMGKGQDVDAAEGGDSDKQVRGQQDSVTLAEKAGWDAAKEVNREIYSNGTDEPVGEEPAVDVVVEAKSKPAAKPNGKTGKSKSRKAA